MIIRREQLAMSQNKAAKAFGGSRTTWINWEKGEAQPERFNYIRIETALRWQPGSVNAILEGGAPTPLEDVQPTVPPVPEGVFIDPDDWAAMTPKERADYVRIVTGVRRRRQQTSRGA